MSLHFYWILVLEGNWDSDSLENLILGCFGGIPNGRRIVFVFCFCLRFWMFFLFLSRYHLPCICNSLELEPVILHGICYILAWSLCILHGICYMWPCSPSILHGICHILPFQLLICMVFATVHFGTSKVHVGLLRVL